MNVFDECHRSQFEDSHKAIKNFFPKAQLFEFTGTPIFEENTTYKQIDGTIGSYTTTKDIFKKELHAYTITHAIDDGNVLRFHIDYFKPENDRDASKFNEQQQKRAVVQTILSKHDMVTNVRRYNAILATASINDAIEYYELFKEEQQKLGDNGKFNPLNILRFPEFMKIDLDITTLGKISSVIKERAEEDEYILMSVTSGVGLIPQKEKFGREIAGESYKNYVVIKKYDFVYNKSATKKFPEGYVAMLEQYNDTAVPNSIFTCFRIIDAEGSVNEWTC